MCVCVCVFQTPLHCAAASTHGAVCLEILVNEHADINAKVAAVCLLSQSVTVVHHLGLSYVILHVIQYDNL